MENIDRCVCCGAAVPEGTMVCNACKGESQDIKGLIELVSAKYNVKLNLFQRFVLKVCDRIVKPKEKRIE